MTKNTKKEITALKFTNKVEGLPNSQVKITVTVPKESFQTLYQQSLVKACREVKVQGFRQGHVPEKIFLEKYGEMSVLQEMAYEAVDQTYVHVVIETKAQVISQPKVAMTKLAKDEDFEYEVIVDVLPVIKLPEYKKYHKDIKEKKAEEITEEEIEKAILELRTMRKTNKEGELEQLPEMNAEFLKTLGDFKTVEDLKQQIKVNLGREKSFRAEDLRRAEILDTLIANTEGEMPESLINNELQRIEDRLNQDLSQMGLNLDTYLKHVKKTKTEWLESEKGNALKQAKMQVALLQIGKEENIKVSTEALDKETAHLLLHYTNLDKDRARSYSEERMTNSLILEFICTGSTPDEAEFFKVDHEHN